MEMKKNESVLIRVPKQVYLKLVKRATRLQARNNRLVSIWEAVDHALKNSVVESRNSKKSKKPASFRTAKNLEKVVENHRKPEVWQPHKRREIMWGCREVELKEGHLTHLESGEAVTPLRYFSWKMAARSNLKQSFIVRTWMKFQPSFKSEKSLSYFQSYKYQLTSCQ